MSEFPGEVNNSELEFRAAFYLEQKLVAEGAPEIEIFMARQDRMAKELVCMEQVGQTEDYPFQADDKTLPLDVKKPDIETTITSDVKPTQTTAKDKPNKLTEIKVGTLTESTVIHKSYRPAAEAAIQLSGLVEKEELHDTHGLPLGGNNHNFNHDYETIINETLNGIRDIDQIPKPYTPLMRAKAKQALSSIAGDTEDSLKTDEWIKKFFKLQVSLSS